MYFPPQLPIFRVIHNGRVRRHFQRRHVTVEVARSGRLARLQIVLQDRPGALFRVMSEFHAHNVNIIEIYHQRIFTSLPAKGLITDIECEARDPEQIDALVTLSTHPMKYLTVPRVLAALITVPVLVGVGDIVGIFGGYQVATGTLGFNPATYLKNTVDFLEPLDVISSLVKGAVFGVIAAVMGCQAGMNSGRGAQGVGRATKSAVEAAAVMILAANFLLTGVFFSL